MPDKTGQILKAALQVFAKKGYSESTTQEIAGEAQVAEVTLFRKFKSKQNLFVSAVQSVLMSKFDKILLQSTQQENTEKFIFELLSERLNAISKNQMMIKTLLSESLMGNLEPAIDLPMIMFQTISTAMKNHFGNKQAQVNTDHLARLFSGVLVSYLIWIPPIPFYKLSTEEQAALVENYVELLSPCWVGTAEGTT